MLLINRYNRFAIIKKTLNTTLIGVYLLILIPSCKKTVDINPPIDRIISEQVFESDATANAAVVGLYSQMMSYSRYFYTGMLEVYTGLTSDELTNTSSIFTEDDFKNNDITTDNTIIQTSFWTQPYFYVYTCNALIEGLEKSNKLTDSVKNQLLGEAKFNRALSYFLLTNLFGDIPLPVTTDSKVNSRLARSTSSNVIDLIISDLKEAQSLLKPEYWTSGKARPNKWAATTLLARMYLYKSDWASAEEQANSVINSGMYTLVSDVTKTFLLSNNTEAIWTLLSSNASINNSFQAWFFIPTSSSILPTYVMSSSLMASFETTDKRKTAWIGSNTVNVSGVPTVFYYPAKYKVRGGAAIAVTESNIPFRLAELYLIRAEARAQLNKLTDAKSDLNAIRARAGLSPNTSTDQTVILSAIEHERQVELFCEWGHRWFDIKRNGNATSILTPIKGSHWQSTDELYPIPVKERLYNNYLSQNDGYN